MFGDVNWANKYLLPESRFTCWLRGLELVKFSEEPHHTSIRLIDFNDPACNTLVVSDEGAVRRACFDVVGFVNGLSLVVGETKTVVDDMVSCLKSAKEIAEDYQPSHPVFFVPTRVLLRERGKSPGCSVDERPCGGVTAGDCLGRIRRCWTCSRAWKALFPCCTDGTASRLRGLRGIPGQRGGLDRTQEAHGLERQLKPSN